jgi:hypothetical protein
VDASVDLALDAADVVPRVARPAVWEPTPARRASVELDAGTVVVPDSGTEERLRWYDGRLCGEVPAAVVVTAPVVASSPVARVGLGHALPPGFAVRSTPNGEVLARLGCTPSGGFEEAAAAWAEPELPWSRDTDPRVEVLEVVGDEALVEVRGEHVVVRGWARATDVAHLPSVGHVVTFDVHTLGRGAVAPTDPGPEGALPAGAPLYDAEHGAVVGTVSTRVEGFPVCLDGRWARVDVHTAWGSLVLRADPRDVLAPQLPSGSVASATALDAAVLGPGASPRCR